jgi:FKBP-type peptidyl-prolyl cis-trans isomerase FkpA
VLATAIRIGLVALGAAACGDAEAPAARAGEEPPAPSAPAEPATLERGDGLTLVLEHAGDGAQARRGDLVSVRYTARVDGAEQPFASTRTANRPLTFVLGERGPTPVLPGMVRGIEGLRSGARATLRIPPALGYGSAGLPAAGVPADATLVVELELVAVRPAEDA